MRRVAVLVACLAIGLANVAPLAQASPSPRASTLAWRACYGGFQCATLRVPLDYSRPDGPTLGIAVLRQVATDPSARRGAIVVNPGGPGVPGLDYGISMAMQLPSSVTSQYDVIGFDPRGVGESSPISCLGTARVRTWLKTDATPDTARERKKFARLSAGLGTACERSAPRLLPHIGTFDTARDLDLLRAGLGDDRLSFFGASYGTFLGATYARIFPDRVDRMVLDGAVDPTLDQYTLTRGQIGGFDGAAQRMARWCATSSTCRLKGDTRAVLGQVNSVLASLDAHPMDTRIGGPLTQSEALTALLASLYSQSDWSTALDAFADAVRGDGTALASLGRGFLTSDPDLLASFLAISCFDSPAAPGAKEVSAWATREASTAAVPELARYLAWSVLPCSTWPAHSRHRPAPVRAPGTGPIVVVGTKHDPATPPQWAHALARELENGVLLRWNGDGHTAYGRGSGCVDKAIEAYLATGIAPADGADCPR